MSKHTPGPWHTGNGNATRIIYAADGYAVADAKAYHGVPIAQCEANAALIAAAPELLAACHYALDCATNKRDGRTLEEMAAKVREMLADAIAKAEG